MLTLREAVIEQPFRDRRYRQHRRKVASAAPRIDARTPPRFPHVRLKLRQQRIEEERQRAIEQENIRLAHRMAHIMRGELHDFFGYRCDSQRGIVQWPRGHGRGVRGSGGTRGPTSALSNAPSAKHKSRNAEAGKPSSAAYNRLIQHRAPLGRVRVPRVGSTQRCPTPPLPHPRGTQHYRALSPLLTAMEGLSVREQLEPLVLLTGDSRPDSGDCRRRPPQRTREELLLLHQTASQFKQPEPCQQTLETESDSIAAKHGTWTESKYSDEKNHEDHEQGCCIEEHETTANTNTEAKQPHSVTTIDPNAMAVSGGDKGKIETTRIISKPKDADTSPRQGESYENADSYDDSSFGKVESQEGKTIRQSSSEHTSEMQGTIASCSTSDYSAIARSLPVDSSSENGRSDKSEDEDSTDFYK